MEDWMNYCGSIKEYSHRGMCSEHVADKNISYEVRDVSKCDGIDTTSGIKRDSNGTIDHGHYTKVSRSLRSDAMVDFLKGLLRLA